MDPLIILSLTLSLVAVTLGIISLALVSKKNRESQTRQQQPQRQEGRPQQRSGFQSKEQRDKQRPQQRPEQRQGRPERTDRSQRPQAEERKLPETEQRDQREVENVRHRLTELAQGVRSAVQDGSIIVQQTVHHKDWLWVNLVDKAVPSTPRGLALVQFRIRYRKPDVWEILTVVNRQMQGFRMGEQRIGGRQLGAFIRKYKDQLGASLGTPPRERRGNDGALQFDTTPLPESEIPAFITDYIRLRRDAVSYALKRMDEEAPPAAPQEEQREKTYLDEIRQVDWEEEEHAAEEPVSEPSEPYADETQDEPEQEAVPPADDMGRAPTWEERLASQPEPAPDITEEPKPEAENDETPKQG